jgi:hypothetical protein
MTPNSIEFIDTGRWVMRITADRRIEVNEGVDVSEAAQKVLDAMQGLLTPQRTEQEPVAWLEPEWREKICPEVGYEVTMTDDHPRDLCWIPLYTHPPHRTEQEPVQEPYKGLSEHMMQETNGRVRIDPVTGNTGIGTPPQRTWVGLTDEEENEYNYLGPDMHWVIQEIAAKLKEKNT